MSQDDVLSDEPTVTPEDGRAGVRLLLVGSDELADRIRSLMAAPGGVRGHADRVTDIAEIDRHEGGPWDVILVEVDGPDQVRTIGRLSGRESLDAPVIALTTSAGTDHSADSVGAGAVDALPIDDLSVLLLDRAVRYAVSNREAERKLRDLALIDDETGLSGEPLFWEVLSLAVRRATRNKDHLALFQVRAGGLDDIEDVEVRSAVIRQMALRLRGVLRGTDTVARFDLRHFGLLVEGMPHLEDVQTVAEKVIEAVTDPIPTSTGDIELIAWIGISMFPSGATTAETLMRNAAEGMVHASEQGYSGFHFD